MVVDVQYSTSKKITLPDDPNALIKWRTDARMIGDDQFKMDDPGTFSKKSLGQLVH